jgi:hypothetical protein
LGNKSVLMGMTPCREIQCTQIIREEPVSGEPVRKRASPTPSGRFYFTPQTLLGKPSRCSAFAFGVVTDVTHRTMVSELSVFV